MENKAVAFNYERQIWESGAEAVAERRKQLQDELDLLTGPEAARYARFCGIPQSILPSAIARIRAELANLN